MWTANRKAERQALQLLQRAEKKQRDELEHRAALKRTALGQQLDQRRQVSGRYDTVDDDWESGNTSVYWSKQSPAVWKL